MASERVNPETDPAMMRSEAPADGCVYALLILGMVVLLCAGVAAFITVLR